MVRMKRRYLVVNYLYPSTTTLPNSKDAPLPSGLQFHQPTPDGFDAWALYRAIMDGVSQLFGDYGAGVVRSDLKTVYHSNATSTSIVRCPAAHYEMVWAALTFMTQLRLPRGEIIPAVVKVVRITGTIRKAEEEVIRRAKEVVLRARMADETGDVGIIGGVMKAVEKRREAQVMAMQNGDDNDEEEDEDEEDD